MFTIKKLLSAIMITTLLFASVSCSKKPQNDPEKRPLSSSNAQTADITTNLKDFSTFLESMGYETEITVTKDATVVEIIKPSPETDKKTETTGNETQKLSPETNARPAPETTRAPDSTKAPETTKPPTPTSPPETTRAPETTARPAPETTKAPETTAKPTPSVPPAPEYSYTTNQVHTKLTYENRFLYSLLNEQQKGWYRAIDTAVKNCEPMVTFDTDLTKNENYNIYFLYMMDNPEVFYLGNNIGIYTHGDGTSSLEFTYAVGSGAGEYCGMNLGEMTPELKNKILAKKAVFDAEVARITSTIPANAPDVVKEKLIYDRILIDSYYNTNAHWDDLANDNWTAYGIMINKYGVCESYSEAFQTLCYAVGINCIGVVGTADGGDHKWNAVKLDGEWYMCDVTFDDPIGGQSGAVRHEYFNITSNEMSSKKNHTWGAEKWPVPDCTATKYSYNQYFGNN